MPNPNPSPATRFKKGQSGNPGGKPIGAQTRLNVAFYNALAKDFELHGAKALQDLRKKNPALYAQLALNALPKKVESEAIVNVTHSGSIEHRSASEIGERVADLLGAGTAGDRPASLPH